LGQPGLTEAGLTHPKCRIERLGEFSRTFDRKHDPGDGLSVHAAGLEELDVEQDAAERCATASNYPCRDKPRRPPYHTSYFSPA
jgi:hypothetical protein